MIQNISVVNSKMYLKVGNAVCEVDNFSPESNMWEVDDIETGDMQRTPDGRIVAYTKQAIFSASLTLNGASEAAKLLAAASQKQIRIGNKKAQLPAVQVIIENDGVIRTYSDGILNSGKPDLSMSNEKLQDRTFKMKFGGLTISDTLPFVI